MRAEGAAVSLRIEMRSEIGSLREHMAHLEGLLKGFREAIGSWVGAGS